MNRILAYTLAILSLCVATRSFAQSSGDSPPVNPFRLVIEAKPAPAAKPTPAVKSAPEKAAAQPFVEFAAYDEPVEESETADEEPQLDGIDETEELVAPAPAKKKRTQPESVLTSPAPAKPSPAKPAPNVKPATSSPREKIIPDAEVYDDFAFEYGGDSYGDYACGNDYFFGERNRHRLIDDFYARVEYLLWYSRGDHVPALVSTTSGSPAFSNAGVLGTPNTSVLFGDGKINDRAHSGIRAVMGFCLSPTLAIEGDYLYGGKASTSFDSASSGNPILARPFFNVAPSVNREDASVLAFSGGGANDDVSGNISIRSESVFQSGGLFLRTPIQTDENFCSRAVMVDFITGYRFGRLRENISFATSQTAIENPLVAPINTVTSVTESFRVYNTFHGADFGLIWQRPINCAILEVTTRVAIGGVRRSVNIRGQTTVTEPNANPVTTNGGLLARPSNIGDFGGSAFAVLPELSIRLNFEPQEKLSYSIGYTLIGLSGTYRAGDLIDRSINLPTPPNPVVGQQRPTFPGKEVGYWAQGVNVGLTYNY